MEAVPSGASTAAPTSVETHAPTARAGRPRSLDPRRAGRRLGARIAARGRTLTTWLLPPLAVAALVLLLLARRHEVEAALAAVPPLAFPALVVTHLATLVLRSEAWRLALASVTGRRPTRDAVHGANGAAFLAGALVAPLALPVRALALRRLDPHGAPRPLQVVATDAPIAVVEAVLTTILLAACVLAGSEGSLPAAAAAVAGAAGLVLLLRWAARRFAHRPAARGLAILEDRRRRTPFVVLLGAIQLLGAGRALAALALCGVPVVLTDAGPLHAALGAAGLLPIGVAASPAGVAAAAGDAGGAVLAGGLVVAASSVAAVAVYAAALALGLGARRVARRPVGT
jgi:hypothetical protein